MDLKVTASHVDVKVGAVHNDVPNLEVSPLPRVSRRSRPKIVIYELRIELRDIAPAIWRQVLVPSIAPLNYLHGVIQECFGWQDYHLYRFEFVNRAFERPDAESGAENATRTELAELELSVGDEFLYRYDFGDDWCHTVRVMATHDLDPEMFYPACVDGARAGPPEDSGGPPGYERLLTVLAHPKHPEYRDLREWVGPRFNPEVFDIRATNRILQLAFSE